MSTHSGSCLCNKVKFEVSGDLPKGDGCHCTMCSKWTGHYLTGVDVKKANVKITGEEFVSWYQSSEKVRRGFCSKCGSSLFFDAIYKDWMGISLGAFDQPTGTSLALHIFVGEKGDYYDLKDDVPKFDKIPEQHP